MWNINAPRGRIFARFFNIKFAKMCTPYQNALAVKISLDLLDGLRSYGGFNMGVLSWWCRVSAKSSAARSGETMRQTRKSFRGARTCLRSSITVPSLVGLGFHPQPEKPKTLSFLSVCQFVRHAHAAGVHTPGGARCLCGGKIKYVLIAYFLGNICAKNCRNRTVYNTIQYDIKTCVCKNYSKL